MMKKLTAFLKAYALPIFAVFAIVLGIVFVQAPKMRPRQGRSHTSCFLE